jgi:hypothetical protein
MAIPLDNSALLPGVLLDRVEAPADWTPCEPILWQGTVNQLFSTNPNPNPNPR